MRCEDAEESLIDFYYQELEPAAHRDMAAHVAECRVCARAYLALHRDLSSVERAVATVPGEQVAERLRAEVGRIGRPPFWQRVSAALDLRIPLYQAAAVALVVAGLSLGLRSSEPAPMPFQAAAPDLPAARPAVIIPVNYDAQGLLAIDDHVL